MAILQAMVDKLEALENQLPRKRNFDTPPLHLWHPPLSGDIPIVIEADGSWYHDGGRIQRESLVRLFASILRREEDGDYYLVTPAEKWRISVALHPLMVTDIDRVEQDGAQFLEATLNTGRRLIIGRDYPLFLESAVGDIAGVRLDHGLTALFTRAAWYRLVELSDDGVIMSGDYEFSLAPR